MFARRVQMPEGLMQRQAKKSDILLIAADDTGYSDCEPFSGKMPCPRLVKPAEEEVRFRHFHTLSLCALTRSLRMTGVDNHLNSLGVMRH